MLIKNQELEAKNRGYDLSEATYKGEHYNKTLHALQIELVKLQCHLIAKDERVLVIFEGRDAAGKDGTIKRLTAHMAPRETIVFAPSKPNERERSAWYFQRYAPHIPGDGEGDKADPKIVLPRLRTP
jgi:polyphosphate kinase 2 (PPK2 family)